MNDVATVTLPYVQAFTDRHGKTRYYYRRAGFKRVSLPGEPGSVEFAVAYEKAGKGLIERHAMEGPRSIGSAIAAYYATPRFKALKPSSRRAYRGVLEAFRKEHGRRPLAGVNHKRMEALLSPIWLERPAAAVVLRKRLKLVFDLAVKEGRIAANPLSTLQLALPDSDGHRAWTDDDLAQFAAFWKSGTRERLAFALLLDTGQRRSDVVTLGRQHLRDGKISLVQQKTGARLTVPVLPSLKAELDQIPADQMTFLLTQYGKPFSPAGFTQWFVERARKAGLVGLSPHGLRKARGRLLAEAGCTTHEIAAWLGHESLEMVQLYTKAANQARLADAAAARLEQAGNAECQPGLSNRA